MTRLRAWYAGLPNPVKAGVATFVAAFCAVFVPAFIGYGNDVLTWVSDWGQNSGNATPFPDPSVLTKAGVAAVVAAGTGLLTFLFRAAQARFSFIPGSGPKYPTG